jgi:hypothetical protein
LKRDDEIPLHSHSVIPENKGVILGKWYLVTGTQKEIYELGRRVYFVV